jgi:hypothetical protein
MELMTDLIIGSLLAGVCARTLLQILVYARSLGDREQRKGCPGEDFFLFLILFKTIF